MIKKLFEQWLRPKTKQQIMNIRQRLAIAYAFVGWNCFAVGFYILMKDKTPEDPEARKKSYSLLTTPNTKMKVYQITGTKLTANYTMECDKETVKMEHQNRTNKIKTEEH